MVHEMLFKDFSILILATILFIRAVLFILFLVDGIMGNVLY